MAEKERKGDNQKLKMLYLSRIFSEDTDEHHGLTMAEIISKLEAYGVNADRKTLYQDFEELRHFGLDIISDKQGRNTYYYMGSRDFELPELKLLVDSVQSAKFITDKKSQELIKKIGSLSSRYDSKRLEREVIISGRVKTMNESIYYNVDSIHEAIGGDRQIRFHYFQWDIRKNMVLRRNGAWYQVSPWALLWDNENYYLVAFDNEDGILKHFRVDKMLNISMTDDKREGEAVFRQYDLPRYTRSLFGMYAGEEVNVTLEAENEMAGILIDRFGKDIFLIPEDENHIRTTVKVAVSNQFLGWVMALGKGIRIVAPDHVVEMMKAEIRRLSEQYQ